MEIYFLRHGQAEAPLFNTPEEDFERSLTEQGQKDTLMHAVGLKKIVKYIDVILTSPLFRAYQTASIYADVFQCSDAIVETQSLAPPSHLADLLEVIAQQGDVKKILCVGHEPYLGMMATELITAIEDESFFPFKNGAVLRIDMESPILHEEAKLVYFLHPSVLKKLGEVPDKDSFKKTYRKKPKEEYSEEAGRIEHRRMEEFEDEGLASAHEALKEFLKSTEAMQTSSQDIEFSDEEEGIGGIDIQA